jgi:hypothetical protein
VARASRRAVSTFVSTSVSIRASALADHPRYNPVS